MADQPRTDELAQLRAALAAQQGQITALRARADRPRRRFPRRFLPLAIVVLLAALLPLSILAAGPVFSDLSSAAPVHQPNIQAIGDAGITTGFEDPADPTKRLYNPKELVTREEMASFLARTAGLGGNPPVVNALTAQSAQSATNAGNANTVGGIAPNGLVRVARAGGSTSDAPVATTPTTVTNGTVTLTAPAAGFVLVTGSVTFVNYTTACDTTSCNGFVRIVDTVTGAETPFSVAAPTPTTGGQNATVTWVFPVAAGARTFELRVNKNSSGVATLDYFSPQITAIYTPFGSSGSGALEAPEPGAGPTGPNGRP